MELRGGRRANRASVRRCRPRGSGAGRWARSGIVCVLFGLASAELCTAQLAIGVKGGLSIADASVKESGTSLDTGTRTTYHLGAVLYFPLGGLAGVQVEGLISNKGFKRTAGDETTNLELRYIEVPLLLMLQAPTPLIQPRLFVGPSFGFETSCRRISSDSGVDAIIDCQPETRSPDVGVLFGLGVRITGLTIDVSYDVGLTNVSKVEETSIKNRNLAISFGLMFGPS